MCYGREGPRVGADRHQGALPQRLRPLQRWPLGLRADGLRGGAAPGPAQCCGEEGAPAPRGEEARRHEAARPLASGRGGEGEGRPPLAEGPLPGGCRGLLEGPGCLRGHRAAGAEARSPRPLRRPQLQCGTSAAEVLELGRGARDGGQSFDIRPDQCGGPLSEGLRLCRCGGAGPRTQGLPGGAPLGTRQRGGQVGAAAARQPAEGGRAAAGAGPSAGRRARLLDAAECLRRHGGCGSHR
mmetsp:Transcript_33897/g.107657  ORF Transcript_33897/g.107657 Transcript_33897/m.107657 type:complete len:240 (-) Transcript_33897:764-1483(-)